MYIASYYYALVEETPQTRRPARATVWSSIPIPGDGKRKESSTLRTMRKVEAKDAVVFIIDANFTMNSPYGQGSSGADTADNPPPVSSTRLSHAKDAVCSQLVDLMWRTKTNEADVIVLRAGGSF
ncbi:hypothetical protein THAOC_30889 [Thalassiosira oceanica]|uniref:Uncharacterized protein n=1 Tax=Thalassiosira oceanica TaxID=159749 RepID=K0RAH6_THAOC|nr:hypothetical protein THAOC_30889 [Thalassiosira oceanica]|eukprot:EJK50170.1 hypothetical protein THAOC_30889 [Thalassiosira oceanica]